MNKINVVPTISNPKVSPMTEKVKLPCDIIDNEITNQEFFIDLMEVVDSPLIVTDRYCGSTETIKSLGLDSWVKY